MYVDAVTVRLTVDGQRVQENTDYGTARLLDVSSARLYVGGVGVSGRPAAVDARLDSLQGPDRVAAGSLRGGCIRNFRVHFLLLVMSFGSLRIFLSAESCGGAVYAGEVRGRFYPLA